MKPCQLKQLMCGYHDANSIGRFWAHLKSLPAYRHHVAMRALDDHELKKAIPCCIHGDGAEMFRDDEYWVMNWSSAFTAGHDCLLTRFPILILAERQMLDDSVSQQK